MIELYLVALTFVSSALQDGRGLPAGKERADIAFVESGIAVVNSIVGALPRHYSVVSQTYSPGLTDSHVVGILKVLRSRGLPDAEVEVLARKLGARSRPGSLRVDWILAEILAASGQALLIHDGTQLEMWASWSESENYRWDYFPALPGNDIPPPGRLQVHPYNNMKYDPMEVTLGDIRDLLYWGYRELGGGHAAIDFKDGNIQELHIRWSRSSADALPLRMNLNLAFSAIGAEISWHLRRENTGDATSPASTLTVEQTDASGRLLRREDYSWRQSWPTCISQHERDFFPGGDQVRTETTKVFTPISGAQLHAAISVHQKPTGSHVLDWRIEGKLGEYEFRDSLPTIDQLHRIIQEKRHQ